MVTPSFQLPSLFQLLALALTFAHSTPASSSSKCSKPAQERNVLHVDDFVKQMGRKVPLQAAVQWSINVAVEASNTHPTALLFGPHEYRLASSDASAHKPVLEITNSTAHALRIDGCGASIVVTTPMTGLFEVTAARGLRIGNLTVDYDPLPMTQGYVTAVQSSVNYTVQLQPGFPSLMLPHFMRTLGGGWGVGGAAWVLLKSRAHPTRHKEGTLNLIKVAGWTDLGNGTFNVALQHCGDCAVCSGCLLTPNEWDMARPKVGDPVVHVARYDSYPTFGLSMCTDCHFDSVKIHASPSATWVGIGVSGLVVKRVSVEPAPGRWHATNADGVFVVDSRVGPVVEGSRFIATGDDALVVKSFAGKCMERRGDAWTLSGYWNLMTQVGDVIQVCNKRDFVLFDWASPHHYPSSYFISTLQSIN